MSLCKHDWSFSTTAPWLPLTLDLKPASLSNHPNVTHTHTHSRTRGPLWSPCSSPHLSPPLPLSLQDLSLLAAPPQFPNSRNHCEGEHKFSYWPSMRTSCASVCTEKDDERTPRRSATTTVYLAQVAALHHLAFVCVCVQRWCCHSHRHTERGGSFSSWVKLKDEKRKL